MTDKEKAICIACRAFISNLETDKQALEAYNILETEEDGDKHAYHCVNAWVPLEDYDVDAFLHVIDALAEDILRTFGK